MYLFLCVCEFHGPSLEGKDKHCQDSSIDKFPYANKALLHFSFYGNKKHSCYVKYCSDWILTKAVTLVSSFFVFLKSSAIYCVLN